MTITKVPVDPLGCFVSRNSLSKRKAKAFMAASSSGIRGPLNGSETRGETDRQSDSSQSSQSSQSTSQSSQSSSQSSNQSRQTDRNSPFVFCEGHVRNDGPRGDLDKMCDGAHLKKCTLRSLSRLLKSLVTSSQSSQ